MKKPYSVSDGPSFDEPIFSAERQRHQAKVQEAIRQHLADMVADEKIVVTDGRRSLMVPVPEFSEFHIRFDPQTSKRVGHLGEGGDPHPAQSGEGSDRSPKEGGSQPSLDVQETTVSMEDIREAVFDQLELPNLDLNKPAPGAGEDYEPVSVASHGIISHWDRSRTMKRYLLRKAQSPGATVNGLVPDDLRFRVDERVVSDQGGAVVIAMMDTSGSMGSFEKYLAKSFFFWTTEFLRQKYPHVELVFLAHDVRAREVDEETFFHRGASGGTVSSSVYRLGLEVIATRYPSERYNIYAFHFTDGGNLTSDNGLAVATGGQLARLVTLFGYGEIHDTERNASPLYQEFARVPDVGVVILRDKEDIFRAMTQFFGRREAIHA